MNAPRGRPRRQETALPRAGIDSVAWSFLLDRIRGCQTVLELERLERSIVTVHGDSSDAVRTLKRTIAERLCALEPGEDQ